MKLRIAAAAAGVLLLAACGVSEVDIPALEKEIKSGVKEQNGIDVTVECPDQVDWEKGKSFECDVSDEQGTTKKATVTMKDDEGKVAWQVG
jgi:hypothetical protein